MGRHRWFASYDPEVPHSLKPYTSATLLDVMADAVRLKPQNTFLLFKGRRISCQEIDELSNALAAALVMGGVNKGDAVALILPNSPQFILAQIGVWKSGAIPVPLNLLYTENELKQALVQSGARVAIILNKLYHTIKLFQAHHTRIRQVILTGIEDFAPAHSCFAPALLENKGGRRIELEGGDIWLKDLLYQFRAAPRPAIKVTKEDIALLLQSGGIAGIPRGIVITHAALMAEALQLKAWYGSMSVDWEDVVLVTAPLFHVYGNAAVMATAILGRNPIALVPDARDHNDVVNTIKEVRPAFFPAVPTLITALLNHPEAKAAHPCFKSIKCCLSGAGPLLSQTKLQFEVLTGGKFIEGYGLTETTAAITVNPLHGQYKEGSVGLPLPDVIVKIVDAEKGRRELPPGKQGEIIVKCPQMMRGFWNSLEETDEMIRGEWLHTGDIGYMDEQGYLFITAGKKEVIKISGFQVWPREVAEVIRSHPSVSDVRVTGVPDPVQVQAVKAWVVPDENQRCTVEELRSYCRQRLTAYKVPRYIEFVKNLPEPGPEPVLIGTRDMYE